MSDQLALTTATPTLRIALSTVVVPDYDEAINYYVNHLGFHLIQDKQIDEQKRWVVVSPCKSHGHGLLLAKAATDQQRARIGDQTGGRVSFFLETQDFKTTYELFLSKGVRFCEEPRDEAYGVVAVFVDHFGNRWDLLQPSELQ